MNFGSFSSSVPHAGCSFNNSAILNERSNQVSNITSIIDSFENGSFYRTYGTSRESLLGVNIKQELDNVLSWLNSDFIPSALIDIRKYDKQDFQECFEKTRLIKQKFSKLYKFLKTAKNGNRQREYGFACNICEQKITLRNPAYTDVWRNLQQHDHVEQALVNLFQTENTSCSETSSNHSNCINNHITDSLLLISEMHEVNEPSVSDNGSSSTPISDSPLSENNKPIKLECSLPKNAAIRLEPPALKNEINCNNCGLTNFHSNFKFNFQIMFDPLLQKKLYSPRDTSTYLKDIGELGQPEGVPTLQFKAKQIFTCLLCCCDVPSYTNHVIIRQHCGGQRHIRKRSTPNVIRALLAYHEHWKKQEPKYQAHQTYFLPMNDTESLCAPCGRKGTVVSYSFLEDHINSEKHKESFMRAFRKTGSNRLFEYVLKLQAEVYFGKEEVVNDCSDDSDGNVIVEDVIMYMERNDTYEENKRISNSEIIKIDEELSTLTITENRGETSEEKREKKPNTKSEHFTTISDNKNIPINKPTKDISDHDLRQRRALAEVAADNSDAAEEKDSNAKPNDSLNKNKQQDHVIIRSMSNELGTELEDLLEHRFLPHLKLFLKTSINTVECQKCNIKMSKHPKVVRDHICSRDHQAKANIIDIVYQFYCEICNVTLKQNFRWKDHLLMQKHIERCERLGASRKNKLTEYECETCKMVIFGDDLSIRRHLAFAAGRGARFRKFKEIVLSAEAKALFKSEQYIQERSIQLVREANQVLLNQEPVRKCCRALEAALADVYSNCKAFPFGSRVSGLGNEHSDLDIFVDVGDMYLGRKYQDSRNQEKFVTAACKAFRRRKEEFSHVNPIPTARTPIVQVYHIHSKLDCDLSFRHGLSVENTKFLRLCIDLQPVTQPLILLLKQWAEYCKLQEHITTYALSMMVIFYLQEGGYLMPVHELRQLNPDNVFIIDGWGVVDFSSSITDMHDRIIPYHGPVKEMLKEFFYYYSKFNYATDVICPLLGRPVKKVLFLDKPKGEDLPLEMLAYVQKVSTTDTEYFRARSPFCVQDPFDLSHNLVKACTPTVVDKLKTFCDLTFKHLATIR